MQASHFTGEVTCSTIVPAIVPAPACACPVTLLYTGTDGSRNSTLAKASAKPACAGCMSGE